VFLELKVCLSRGPLSLSVTLYPQSPCAQTRRTPSPAFLLLAFYSCTFLHLVSSCGVGRRKMEAARDEVTSKLADTVATHEKVKGALLVQLQELQSEQRANLKKMEEQERLKKMEEQERATEQLVRPRLQQPRPVSIAPKYKLACRQEHRLSSILCTEETSQLTCKKWCRARRRRRRRATRQTLEAMQALEAVCGGHTQL